MSNMHENHRQRMMERCLRTGFASFADHEVLEMLLYYSKPRGDTNETAHGDTVALGSEIAIDYTNTSSKIAKIYANNVLLGILTENQSLSATYTVDSSEVLLRVELVNEYISQGSNLMLEDENKPVVWRGPVIAGAVKQFWTDTIWHDIDYMFIDCPPGTGDVPLTVFQSIPIDGIVIVSSPQELVSMIVSKAANMAQMMNIPVYGLVENMSYVKCPDCGKEIKVFGESHIDKIAEEFGYDLLARIPMDPKLTALVDKGWIEMMDNDYLESAAEVLVNRTQKKL